MRHFLVHTLQRLAAPSIFPDFQVFALRRSTALILPNRLGSATAGLPPFCSNCFCSSSHNGNEPGLEFFEGLYFLGEIPRHRIAQKWSKASGPGGMNVNANPTKAEIRFHLDKADWIPSMVRQRMAQKHPGNMNKAGEFILSSMVTRSAGDNMNECFNKLDDILREVSLDLVNERRREYISPEVAEELERRKEHAERWRIAQKRRLSDKKANRRAGRHGSL